MAAWAAGYVEVVEPADFLLRERANEDNGSLPVRTSSNRYASDPGYVGRGGVERSTVGPRAVGLLTECSTNTEDDRGLLTATGRGAPVGRESRHVGEKPTSALRKTHRGIAWPRRRHRCTDTRDRNKQSAGV
jgi:hypothetical protein